MIRRFRTLDHISPVNEPAYPDTGIWLSSEYFYDLPRRLRALSEIWHANRPRYDAPAALRKMSRAVSRLPRRAVPPAATPRSQARPVARRRVLAPLALHEIYPAFGGFSSVEIAKMAFQERKNWRMFKSKSPSTSRAKAGCANMIGRASGAGQPAQALSYTGMVLNPSIPGKVGAAATCSPERRCRVGRN